MDRKRKDSTKEFERPFPEGDRKYRFATLCNGTTPRSVSAIRTSGRSATSIERRYDLEVIDIYQQPVLRKGTDYRRAYPAEETSLALRRLSATCQYRKTSSGVGFRPKKNRFASRRTGGGHGSYEEREGLLG